MYYLEDIASDLGALVDVALDRAKVNPFKAHGEHAFLFHRWAEAIVHIEGVLQCKWILHLLEVSIGRKIDGVVGVAEHLWRKETEEYGQIRRG